MKANSNDVGPSCYKAHFSLEKERSPVQLVTIMHMNTCSAISTFGNTVFKLPEIICLSPLYFTKIESHSGLCDTCLPDANTFSSVHQKQWVSISPTR